MSEPLVLEFQESVAFLRLAPEGEKIPILTEERMAALERKLLECKGRGKLTGIVITGNSAGFCGGADISAIEKVTSWQEGERLAQQGQRVFQLIEDLPFPTVALIHGACAGGGCELALACRYRIMSSGESSKIGLPEVKLGIIPGFGGTQRLPRLIGLPEAAKLILKGRLLGAEEAKRAGLVDEVAAESKLGERALALLKSGIAERKKLPFLTNLLTTTSFGRTLVAGKLERSVKKETGGMYPAPPRAIQAMLLGLAKPGPDAYAYEAKSLGELIVSPECKSLVHVFHATEGAQRLGKAKREEAAKLSAVVVGAGVMGSGIAAVFGSRGYDVTIVDSAGQALQHSRERVKKIIRGNKRLSPEKQQSILDRIAFEASLDRVSGAGLVVEAIFEDFEAKRGLLREIVERASDTAIIATNTSSLSVTDLAEELRNPERIIGMHFFNPAEKMPLVEIIRGARTDERSLLVTAAVTAAIGKYPIIVENGAGFLVNRLLTPYLAEAGILLSEGFSVEQIDGAAKGFGMPMGPFRLLDEVGLDVAVHVSRIMEKAYGAEFGGPNYAERLLKAGRKGRKTGSGFYLYQGESETVNGALQSFLSLPAAAAASSSDITDRLVLRMVKEALRCWHSGVAGRPGQESAQQIDLGTVMGCGFPPFRGGVLHYCLNRGRENIERRLAELEKKYGPRFAPPAELDAYFQSAPVMK